jgi:hypothetical protein
MQLQVARSDTSSGTSVPPTDSDRLIKPSVWSTEPGTSPREPHKPGDDRQTSQQSANSNGAPRPERPPEFCPAHPGGTTERCGDCANYRRVATAWDRARAEEAATLAERIRAEIAAEAKRIDDCTDCAEVGHISVYDDDGNELGVRRCERPRLTAIHKGDPDDALPLAERLLTADDAGRAHLTTTASKTMGVSLSTKVTRGRKPAASQTPRRSTSLSADRGAR